MKWRILQIGEFPEEGVNARGSYKPLNLISLQGRLKETAAIWFIIFSLLLAVVFSLKVGANLWLWVPAFAGTTPVAGLRAYAHTPSALDLGTVLPLLGRNDNPGAG